MKHIFVVNPNAGLHDATNEIYSKLSALTHSIDYEVYVTNGTGDATAYVDRWCLTHEGEAARFYACGGDGTLNEVVSGVIGHPNVQLSCYPCGSGNDYVKYYLPENLDREAFLNLDRLTAGDVRWVDVMKVEVLNPTPGQVRYSINVCNIGFDAAVASTMNKIKRKPIIGGKRGYMTGIVKSLFTSRQNTCHILVDGQLIHYGNMMLCTISNGRYVGGRICCAPQSVNDDGLADICVIKPLTLPQCFSLLGPYIRGEHYGNPKFASSLSFHRGSVIEMQSPDPFIVCIDGEIILGTRYRVSQEMRAVPFVIPCQAK